MTHARNTAVGDFGERIATDYLTSQGMIVLERNWRCQYGEVDIIARDGSTLVICEVKTRSSTSHGPPAEAVSAHKASRLRRLSAYWMNERGINPPSIRIDVVSVLIPERGAPHVDRIAGVA